MALVLFPLLSALALKQTAGNVAKSGLLPHIDEQCSPTTAPYRLPYTGLPAVDTGLCGVVAFFHLAFTPPVRPFLDYFLYTAPVLLAIPALEGVRQRRSGLLAFPVVYGLCMQMFTAGAVYPIYWLAFISTGAHRRSAEGTTSTVSAAHAQAVAFGLFIGAAVPTMCLVWLEDPYITVLWQLFPLWQLLAQSAHLLVRKPTGNRDESGFTWIQALYVGVFMIASSTHISALAKGDLNAIFVPSLEPRVGAAPELQVLDLLQWDGIFAFVSSLLGTVWFGRTTTEAACILLWNVLGTMLVGPGAALAAVALWRESHLYST